MWCASYISSSMGTVNVTVCRAIQKKKGVQGFIFSKLKFDGGARIQKPEGKGIICMRKADRQL